MIGLIGIFIKKFSSQSYITLLKFHLIFVLKIYNNFLLYIVPLSLPPCSRIGLYRVSFYRFLEPDKCHSISQWIHTIYNIIVHVQWKGKFICAVPYVNYVPFNPNLRSKGSKFETILCFIFRNNTISFDKKKGLDMRCVLKTLTAYFSSLFL